MCFFKCGQNDLQISHHWAQLLGDACHAFCVEERQNPGPVFFNLSCVEWQASAHWPNKLTTCSQKFNQQQLAQPARALIKIRYKEPLFFLCNPKLGQRAEASVSRGKVLAEASGFASILESQNQRGTEKAAGGTGSHYASQLYFIYLSFFFKELT